MNSPLKPLDNQSTLGQPERNHDLLVSVSAVLPRQALQVQQRIEKALEVLSKAYEFYELLVVDNGSPFVVQAHVLELQRRLPNVRLLRLSRCYSREVAIAAALDHCIGDYVVTMDLMTDPRNSSPFSSLKPSRALTPS